MLAVKAVGSILGEVCKTQFKFLLLTHNSKLLLNLPIVKNLCFEGTGVALTSVQQKAPRLAVCQSPNTDMLCPPAGCAGHIPGVSYAWSLGWAPSCAEW